MNSEEYSAKVLPFIEDSLFRVEEEKVIFRLIKEFAFKYNSVPTYEALIIDLTNKSFDENVYKSMVKSLDTISGMTVKQDLNWMIDTTERWIKREKFYSATEYSTMHYQDETKRGKILQMFQDAEAISIRKRDRLDYLEDADAQYDWMHEVTNKIPFGIKYFDLATDGGMSPETLTIFMAGTNVGKSLLMSHFAAYHLMQGKNVLYISMELKDKELKKRIDANLLDVPISYIKSLSAHQYKKKHEELRAKTVGKLIIRRYPTAQAHAGHFKAELKDILIVNKRRIDVLYVDYLNICLSYRYMKGEASHVIMKAISEELRGLAVEFGIPLVTATQTNREGFRTTDFGLEHTSDSFGMQFTADDTFGLIVSEEYKKLNRIRVKYLKSRSGDKNKYPFWDIGVDYDKMRIYDVDNGLVTNSKMTNETYA